MDGVSLERCLTMAAYSALLAIRQYLQSHPSTASEEAIATIRRINSDASYLDYVGGLLLHELISKDASPDNPRTGLRVVIRELVQLTQPWWLRLTPYGREKLRIALEQDQAQCFREAGLFDPVPDEEVIAWWDETASSIRGIADAERLSKGREAEKLSLEHERERLRKLGIPQEPLWVSLEDNTLGYDIRSYDLLDGLLVNRLIEVKSAQSEIIHVTRNEWNNAVSARSRYLFHIWRMPKAELLEIPVAEVRDHIPADRGKGIWQDVKINLA